MLRQLSAAPQNFGSHYRARLSPASLLPKRRSPSSTGHFGQPAILAYTGQ
jgi:hypothetical protein